MPAPTLQEAVIVDCVRTPIGRYGGVLSSVRPDDLAALTIKTLVERNKLDTEQIEDVFFGDGNQSGEDNRNVARMSSLLAGLPFKVAGCTVNRLCGSGLEAINLAAHEVMLGNGSIYLAGGVESMSRAPFVVPKSTKSFERKSQIVDTTIGWRLSNPKLEAQFPLFSMGETAENLAERYKINREEQDKFALKSHEFARRAQDQGLFKEEIVPVPVTDRDGKETLVESDEGPRSDISLEKLGSLKPAFREGGSVTAGNSCGINDGASACLLMSSKRAKRLGFSPRVRIVATAVSGVHPSFMGLGPVPATRKVLKRARLELDQIELVELNEAFAAQVLSCLKFMNFDAGGKMNVNGGAIALGHPIGCSGARIMTTLVHEIVRRKLRYGLATMCIGVGQGIATLIERVE
ncbi:MAG TPA: thiolase family protein [Nitrososphaerales archaeon]|nr:thiolase family protein [Nitrososphaerales archaeon]